MKLGLKEKVAIVTGGASNIGRAISLALAEEGCNLVVADLDKEGAEAVVDKAKSFGVEAIAIETDVTKPDQVSEMVSKVMSKFGRIDILVNDAGWARDALFIEKSREEWEREIAVNFCGVVNCTRAVIEHMMAQNEGRIVTISSDAGRIGEWKETVYSGAKGAVIAFSKSLAKEVGRYNIRVNSVCPGLTIPDDFGEFGKMAMLRDTGPWLSTPGTLDKVKTRYPLRRPEGKLGKPQDIANAVVFLVSDAASWITGQTLSVSGGYSMV